MQPYKEGHIPKYRSVPLLSYKEYTRNGMLKMWVQIPPDLLKQKEGIMPRRKVEKEWWEYELGQFKKFLEEKIIEKGDLSFISSHEIKGALTEEVDEFNDEVKSNDKEKQIKELFDVMVVAFWGIVSIRQAGTEW